MTGQDFGKQVIRLLMKRYGREIRTSLRHQSDADLFTAVLLSPQCSDEQVDKATAHLFKRFRTFDDYANANAKTLRSELNGVNFYKTKARHLRASAKIISEKYNGKIPHSMNELMALPGVGRKVANILLNEVYGINEGIAIDTHCIVTSNRLGLARSKDPTKVERALMGKIPKKDWPVISNLLIALGRDTCTARRTYCERCVLRRICPSSTA